MTKPTMEDFSMTGQDFEYNNVPKERVYYETFFTTQDAEELGDRFEYGYRMMIEPVTFGEFNLNNVADDDDVYEILRELELEDLHKYVSEWYIGVQPMATEEPDVWRLVEGEYTLEELARIADALVSNQWDYLQSLEDAYYAD